MKQVRWFHAFGLAAITLMISLTMAAQSGNPEALQQKLYTQFKLTTIMADRSDIVTPGDVVAIHKPGLVMYAVAAPLPPSNTYKHGRIGQGWSGFGKDMAITMMTSGGGTAVDYPHRTFVPEEKCWVTGIHVEGDDVLFQLYSDPYDGVRYYSNLKIPFPQKKVVPPADEFLQTVAEVLTVVPQDNQGGQGAQSGQGGQPVGLSGQYFLKETGARLILLPDGSFTLFAASGAQSPGLFTVNGDTLTLTYSSTGRSGLFKIQEDNLVADTGLTWVRTGDAPAASGPATNPPQNGPAPPIAGEYTATGGSRILLLPDGSFTKFVAGGQGHGQYVVNGDNLTLTFTSTGFSQGFRIQGGNLLDVNTNLIWARTGDAPAAAPAPMPAIAPPPPPVDTPPPTIAIGQTVDQVIAGFGQPLKEVKLGVKVIFYYKDMKVIFRNGKVSDVE